MRPGSTGGLLSVIHSRKLDVIGSTEFQASPGPTLCPLLCRLGGEHVHHQMVNIKIRLIIFFAAKYGEALYSQQKQDQELTVAQIILYCQIQTEIEESGENH